MVGKSKGKQRLDKFYHLAREQGYRSRAAFKLAQLNRKYQFLENSRTVLDLCAAPGSWLQVISKHMPISSLVIGVDIEPIRPIKGVITLRKDITKNECINAIKRASNDTKFDLVLHDGSPNVSGAWHSESFSQAILVLKALEIASKFLGAGGWFISKAFRSKDYTPLLYSCKCLFEKVEITKPSASRDSSAEIFIVCSGYKAPEKVDSRLFMLKDMFLDGEGMENEGNRKKRPDAFMYHGKKLPKNREGYESGISTTLKKGNIMEFINSKDPVSELATFTKFSFEDENEELMKFIREHELTTDEIKYKFQDLLLLGKKDFRLLLKWRLNMKYALRNNFFKEEKEKAIAIEEDFEERLMREMKEIRDSIELNKKREKKTSKQQRKKHLIHAAKKIETEEKLDDGIDLFKLEDIKSKEVIDKLIMNEDDELIREIKKLDEEEEIKLEKEYKKQMEEYDSDEMERIYEEKIDEYLDYSYKRYLEAKGLDKEEIIFERRKRLDGELELSDNEIELEEEIELKNDLNEKTEIGGGLLRDLENEQSHVIDQNDIVKEWYDQDLFKDKALFDDNAVEKETNKIAITTNDNQEYDTSEGSDLEEFVTESKNENGFEIVPIEEKKEEKSEDEMDTEDEFRMLDEEGKAEVLALAHKMLRKKDKLKIIDAAYCRYAFHDKDLPYWFDHEETIYMKPRRQVTREEIEKQRELVRALDARPIKKVVEAKARKRHRVIRRLQKAKQKAEAMLVPEQQISEMNTKQVQKLYADAKDSENYKFKKKKKKLSRTQRKYGKKGPPLDPRMKADKRVRGMGRHAKNLPKIIKRKNIEKQLKMNKKKYR